MAPVASRRLPLLVCAGALLALSVGAWWTVPSAHAADQTVAVQAADGGRYAPAETTIELGDTVTWVWEGYGHSVTHDPGPGQERLFDSHPPSETLCPAVCGADGDTFPFSEFPEAGEYEYFSHQDETVRGVVIVTDPGDEEPSPTGQPTRPEPSEDPDPSPDETTEPDPSPSETGQPDPSPTGEQPEPDPESPPPPSPDPGPRSVAPQPVERDAVDPTPTAGAPTVADDASPSPVPDPTFEAFPEADEPDDAGVEGEVAIGGSGGGDTNRTVWALVGGASVLGTLGALGRTLLFSDAWNA